MNSAQYCLALLYYCFKEGSLPNGLANCYKKHVEISDTCSRCSELQPHNEGFNNCLDLNLSTLVSRDVRPGFNDLKPSIIRYF